MGNSRKMLLSFHVIVLFFEAFALVTVVLWHVFNGVLPRKYHQISSVDTEFKFQLEEVEGGQRNALREVVVYYTPAEAGSVRLKATACDGGGWYHARLPKSVTKIKLDFVFDRQLYTGKNGLRVIDAWAGNVQLPARGFTLAYWAENNMPYAFYIHCGAMNGYLVAFWFSAGLLCVVIAGTAGFLMLRKKK